MDLLNVANFIFVFFVGPVVVVVFAQVFCSMIYLAMKKRF
ncbi:Protein of unknown function [Bacillus cytotoxicus]|uniref:Uncharacterized protein n=1 Tax=Bacillus cytotoxicus TaxID=580165 RepID=A0AAX2CNV6_9BACI|nr:Protein of unknown function [Bacillus cytotoxicus]